jgi:hypothetical protein
VAAAPTCTPIVRTFVVGDVLFSLLEQGLATHLLSDLSPIAEIDL